MVNKDIEANEKQLKNGNGNDYFFQLIKTVGDLSFAAAAIGGDNQKIIF